MGDADRGSEALGERGGLQPFPLAEGICLPRQRRLQCRAPAWLLRRHSACNCLLAFQQHLTVQILGIRIGMGSCLESSFCCSLSAPYSHQVRWDVQRSPGHAPAPPCFGQGASAAPWSIADPGGAAKGQHRPAAGMVFQHGETTGWGGCTPPSRKQQQRSAGGDFEQVVQEQAVIFNHWPWPAGSGHPHPAWQL